MYRSLLFWQISGFYFFYFASVGVYIIFLPDLLEGFGYTPAQIGIVFSAAPIMRFLAPFLLLKLLPQDRRTFIGGLIGSLFSAALFALFGAFCFRLSKSWPWILFRKTMDRPDSTALSVSP